MNLRQYVALILRWAWLIVLGMALSGSIAFGLSWRTPPLYSASTTILINQAPVNKSSDYNSLLTSERIAKTYAELMRKRPVLEAVIANLKLDMTPESLAAQIQVSVVRDTQLMTVAVRDSSPRRAQDIANEIVKVFTGQNRDVQSERYAASKQTLEQQVALIQADIDHAQLRLDALKNATTSEQSDEKRQLQALLTQYRDNYASLLKSLGEVRLAEAQTMDSINVVEAAQAGTQPVSPRTNMNTALGVIVGALLALGLVFLREYFDDTVKTSEDVSELIDTMTLATIARMSGASKLTVATDTRSPAAEAYRMLRINLELAAVDHPIRTLLVTSPGSGEGKSTTAANLAVAIARTGKRVVLVDADLRRPVLQQMFGLPSECGLTTALIRHNSALEEYLLPTNIRNLWLMPTGPLPPSAAEMLTSRRMDELIGRLRAWADVVVFDSPPVLPVIDATILARACDATLLVVRASSTRKAALKKAREQFAQVGVPLLGVVLAGIAPSRQGYYGYYTTVEKPWQRLRRWPGRGQKSPRAEPPVRAADALPPKEPATPTQ